MRVTGAATVLTWIPSEAVTGAVLRKPFDLGLSHYDEPPPDRLDDLDAFVAADRCRFANHLSAWVEVADGAVVDYGHARPVVPRQHHAAGSGPQSLTFAAVALPDKRSATPEGTTAVRFEQTAGGRTGVPGAAARGPAAVRPVLRAARLVEPRAHPPRGRPPGVRADRGQPVPAALGLRRAGPAALQDLDDRLPRVEHHVVRRATPPGAPATPPRSCTRSRRRSSVSCPGGS